MNFSLSVNMSGFCSDSHIYHFHTLDQSNLPVCISHNCIMDMSALPDIYIYLKPEGDRPDG